jgi:hypothetical protein
MADADKKSNDKPVDKTPTDVVPDAPKTEAETPKVETPAEVVAPEATVSTPTPATPTETVDSNTITQVTDTVNTGTAQADEADAVNNAVPEQSTEFSLDVSVNDSDIIKQFKVVLYNALDMLSAPGTKPEHFKAAAKAVLDVTNFVIRTPRTEVLELFYQFMVANPHGVCTRYEYFKGSTSLTKFDEQRVFYLGNLFFSLVEKLDPKNVDSGKVLQVLKKPEILNYYQRKIQLLQRAAQTA